VIEPVPGVAAVLRANLQRNGLSRVDVLEAAATPDPDEHDACLSLPDEGRAMLVGAHLREEVEISKRSISRDIMVKGLPIAQLIKGRDLIKIDAEGIEHALLTAALPYIEQHKPTIVVEVLPEAEKLAALIADIAEKNGYSINIVPAYGNSTIRTVSYRDFSSSLPAQFNSKDIVLSYAPLERPSP
jgi:FkbM family methyltransferase